MKAEKINEIIDWAEQEDLNPDADRECLDLLRRASDELLDGELEFDINDNKNDGEYIFCTTYVDIPWKEGFSAVVNWDVLWWYETPEKFAHELWELYDRAMEIQGYFNSEDK